jgi:hypothetical protein
MEVMKAFISAEKLSDDEDVGETPIIEDDEHHSSHGTVTGKLVRNKKEEKLPARNSKEQKLPARRCVQI